MKDLPLSPRIIKIKRKRRALKVRLVILFVVLFFLIVWLLSYLSSFKNILIKEITITGTQIVDQSEIEDLIRESISGKYLGIFSKNNSLIFPRKKIEKNLIETFPRIEFLSVYIDRLNSLRIDINERKGTYLYCGEKIPETENEVGENCYFINNDGLIFDEAPYFSGNVYFKYYLKSGEEGNLLGKQMLDKEEFYRIVRFIDGISSLGFNPIYLEIDENDTGYLYLNHGSKIKPAKIIFKIDDDLKIIEDNLYIAMNKKDFSNEITNKYDSLLYIDLRFDNKVLYKFK